MLDTTDLIILILVTLGTLAYFTKGKLWAKPAQLGYGYGAGAKTATANGIAKPKKTRNIVERMEQQNKNVVVFFGSQTGTAGTNYPPSRMFPGRTPQTQTCHNPLTLFSRGLFFPSRKRGPLSLWLEHHDSGPRRI